MHEKNFQKNGFIFIKNNNNIKEFINSVNEVIFNFEKKHKFNLNKIDTDKFDKISYQLQTEINKNLSPKKFFSQNKNIFKKIFKNNSFAIQHYFYLRAIRITEKKNRYPISFHRETFQGPKFFKKIFNLWIPIRNCKTINSLKYYPISHKFKLKKDFELTKYNTGVIKESFSHKTGNLYKERKIFFKKKMKSKRLFKKDNIILFSGELIHGNATNKTREIRFSIDLRFMEKKFMKFNPIQGATKKNYFTIINLK